MLQILSCRIKTAEQFAHSLDKHPLFFPQFDVRLDLRINSRKQHTKALSGSDPACEQGVKLLLDLYLLVLPLGHCCQGIHDTYQPIFLALIIHVHHNAVLDKYLCHIGEITACGNGLGIKTLQPGDQFLDISLGLFVCPGNITVCSPRTEGGDKSRHGDNRLIKVLNRCQPRGKLTGDQMHRLVNTIERGNLGGKLA